MGIRDLEPSRKMKIARGVVIVSGLVALACTIVMIADWVVAVGRAPSEKSTIETLESQTKTDAATAEALHAERERQTAVTLVRKTRNRRLAWVLLVAGTVALGGGKWIAGRWPQKLPDLETLVADRFPPPAPLSTSASATQAETVPDAADEIDLAFVDDLVARFGRDPEAAIPILQAIQTHFRYLPDEALRRVCELTEITPAQIAGTSSFYAQFRRSPVGRYVVRVCHGTACHVAGAQQITQELRRHLEIPSGEDTDARRLFTIDAVACVGCCSLAPVMMIEDETAGRLTPASARQELDARVPTT